VLPVMSSSGAFPPTATHRRCVNTTPTKVNIGCNPIGAASIWFSGSEREREREHQEGKQLSPSCLFTENYKH
jgi:hypothetical protein